MAGLQIALLPMLWNAWSLPVLLIYLHGPAYMIHQVEEHWDDRFRQFANSKMFGGREVLTTKGVLWVNLPGVWGVNLLALLAAERIGARLGLAAAYLVLINAAGHLVMAVRSRRPNPGVWTALGLFLPLGSVSVLTIHASFSHHLLGLAIGGGLHAVIILGCARRDAAIASGTL